MHNKRVISLGKIRTNFRKNILIKTYEIKIYSESRTKICNNSRTSANELHFFAGVPKGGQLRVKPPLTSDIVQIRINIFLANC